MSVSGEDEGGVGGGHGERAVHVVHGALLGQVLRERSLGIRTECHLGSTNNSFYCVRILK